MDLSDFYAALKKEEARGFDLNEEQKQAVNHTDGPLWVLAGPGSGKSETLVTRTLRLICVDGVDPRSVLVTTFTKKAARSLEDRLASYMAVLQRADPSLADIDLANVRIGTIHSLCNDILQEYRYPEYQNVRLLDDVYQALFMYRHAEIVQCDNRDFWSEFDYLFRYWTPGSDHMPNKWERVKASMILFNRMVEDRVDLESLRSESATYSTLVSFYEQYRRALTEYHRCDFTHVQSIFLNFLKSPQGERFILGSV